MIARHRNAMKNGRTKAGGGVAILYGTSSKMTMKNLPIKNKRHEIVASVGKLANIKRRIVCITIYIPPDITKKARDDIDSVTQIKKDLNNPFIILGGDFNNTSVAKLTNIHQDLEELDSESTHGFNRLDLIFTNIPNTEVKTFFVQSC